MDVTKGRNWAPMPDYVKPITKALAPFDEADDVQWNYTLRKPADEWMKPDFDDSGWRRGPAGFGTRDTPIPMSAPSGTLRTSGCAAPSSCLTRCRPTFR